MQQVVDISVCYYTFPIIIIRLVSSLGEAQGGRRNFGLSSCRYLVNKRVFSLSDEPTVAVAAVCRATEKWNEKTKKWKKEEEYYVTSQR